MKKIVSLIMALALMLSLAACGTTPAPAVSTAPEASADAVETTVSADTAKTAKPYRIGVFFKDSTSMFWRYVGEGCAAKAAEIGVEFVEYSPSSYTDAAGQINMLEDAIASGIDAIAIAAIDSTAVVDTLVKAEDAGIPVIVFNTLIPNFEATGKQRTFIGLDNAAASEEVMERILKEHDYKANVVILEGTPATLQNNERCGTATAVCDKYEGVTIVASQPTNANREIAMTTMENILQSTTDIDIVFAINDSVGLGALQAIEAAGVTGIEIVGIDATPDSVSAMLAGRAYKYSMDQGPFDCGSTVIQAAVDAIEGRELESVVRVGGTCVGADNAQEHMDKYYPNYKG